RDEMNQRDLGGVAFPVEHALAEERTAEPDTVEPADKLAVTPGFDGMAMPDLVQPAVELADPPVDPGSRTPGRGLGAAVDHGPEVAVDEHLEPVGADGAGEPLRQMEPVERYQAPHVGLEPVQRGVVGILRHRENTAG